MANMDNEHYLLRCPRSSQLLGSLFDAATEVLGLAIVHQDSETLCNLLLYGSSDLTLVENRIIIEAMMEYIKMLTG